MSEVQLHWSMTAVYHIPIQLLAFSPRLLILKLNFDDSFVIVTGYDNLTPLLFSQAHKTLRHPSILKYLTVYRSDGGVHVVTEAATPLSLCMEYVTGWEVTVGLSRILQVLQFLHTQVRHCPQ